MNRSFEDLLQHLPTRDDLAHAMDRVSGRSDDRSPELMGAFAFGLFVGAAMSLLFAPRSGREVRARMAEGATRVGEELRDSVSHLRDRVPYTSGSSDAAGA